MVRRVKQCHYPDPDRISNLPEEIMNEILVCLPLKEAARTSILSPKWRDTWTRCPTLVFDQSLFDNSVVDLDRIRRHAQIIYQILHNYKGPIRKFSMSLFELRNGDIKKIVDSVCNKDMKEFKLDLMVGKSYRVGDQVFACRKLEKLYLGNCRLRLPHGFEGFSMLTSLTLCEVLISEIACSSLISSCPKLEKLTLELCTCNCLEIEAPNLRFFECDGFHDAIFFKNTPKLEILSVLLGKVWHQREAATAEEMVLALTALKSMELNRNSLKIMFPGTVPERFQNPLTHLKAIKLEGLSFKEMDEARRVLCLLRSSPNLETITMDSWSSDPVSEAALEPSLEAFKNGCLSDLHLNKLREVVMVSVTGKPSELLLAEIFLASAPVLEEMVIKSITPLTIEDSSFLGKVMQFQRASPKAYITYSHDI